MTTNYARVAVAVYQRATNLDPYLPQLSKEQALAWGSLFERYKLAPEDLMTAVENLYAIPHDGSWRLNVGQLVAGARAIRNDRIERRGYDTGRSDPRVAAFIASEVGKSIPEQKPRRWRPLHVTCPHCRSVAGRACVALGSNRPLLAGDRVHRARIEAAQRAASFEAAPQTKETA